MYVRGTLALSAALLLVFASCTERKEEPLRRSPTGIVSAESRFGYDATVRRLDSVLRAAAPVTPVARIDRAAEARHLGLLLRPTYVALLGHPRLGTPLLQHTPLAGLDLPQKMLVYQDDDGTTRLAYNDPRFLSERHASTDRQERFLTIRVLLTRLARQAAGEE